MNPISSFDSLELHPRLKKEIAAAGFTQPTPIQAAAIPAALTGRDIMGLARTGSGKTAAFVFPLLHRLSAPHGTLSAPHGRLGSPQRPVRAVIVAPTRELAEQIFTVVEQFGRPLGLDATTIYGGVSMTRQVRDLKRGVDIVVACPGRLIDHMNQRTIRLDAVEILVLDEADRMFDMGFLPGIRRIVQALPRERQSLMFSATMPEEVRELAMQMLRSPEVVQVDSTAPTGTVSHYVYPVKQDEKGDLLLSLLDTMDANSVLVFTRTKHRAKRLSQQLVKAGHSAACLQGDMSQGRRNEAMSGFRSGHYRILVATDIAARGIDIASVSHVINLDMPDTVEAYTHRIGRTGRASRDGDAFTFVTKQDESMVRHIERLLGSKIPRRFIPQENGSESVRKAGNDGAHEQHGETRQNSLDRQSRSRGGQSRMSGPRARKRGNRSSQHSSERDMQHAQRFARTQGSGSFRDSTDFSRDQQERRSGSESERTPRGRGSERRGTGDARGGRRFFRHRKFRGTPRTQPAARG